MQLNKRKHYRIFKNVFSKRQKGTVPLLPGHVTTAFLLALFDFTQKLKQFFSYW